MQRAFQNIALATLLLAGSAFAAGSNLLSMATDGAISKSTAETLSLNDKEMKDVVGGYLFNFQNSSTRSYYQISAEMSEKYYGNRARIFYRQMYSGGQPQYWINYYVGNSNTPNYAYGTLATQLMNKYR